MVSAVLTAVTLVDANGCTVGLNAINRLEKLSFQLVVEHGVAYGKMLFSAAADEITKKILDEQSCDITIDSDYAVTGVLLLDGILHLTVLLVHRVSEVLNAEHVAMVGKGEAVHAVFLAFRHQVGHLRHAVEHGIVRVDVQVGEVLWDIVADFGNLIGFFLINNWLKGDACGLDHLGIGSFEVVDELCVHAEVIGIQDATTHQFEEHAGGSLHVGGGIVGIAELLTEENLVELLQAWQFELAALAAGQLAELGGLLGAGVHLLVFV